MKYFTKRKGRSGDIIFLTPKKSFIDKISSCDGWVIRLVLTYNIKKLSSLLGCQCALDFDSETKITEIISKNGDTFFTDPIHYKISLIFMDSFLLSTYSDDHIDVADIFFKRMTNKVT